MTNNKNKGDDIIKKINIILDVLLIILFILGGTLIFSMPVNQNAYISINSPSVNDSNTPPPIVEIPDFGEFINEREYTFLTYNEVDVKVVEDIVYAYLYVFIEGKEMNIKVQIIEDYKNGTRYHVKNEQLDLWVSPNRLDIIYEDDVYPLDPLSQHECEIYVNYRQFTSETDYFVWVDIKRQVINVFNKINNYYFLIKSIPCATGKTSTPTKRGNFVLYDKGPVFYNEVLQYKCYNWFKFSDKYLMHSIPFSYDDMPLNTSMQKKVSSGCIRMKYQDSKWFYNNVPLQTALWIN